MKKTLPQQPRRQDDATWAPLKDQGAGSDAWTCSYVAGRKLWIFRKAHKAHRPEKPAPKA